MPRRLRLPFFRAAALAAAVLLGPSAATSAQTFETQFSASDKAFGDQLGGSLAVDGNTLIAGARQKSSSTGAAYVFRRATNGTWSQEAKLTGTGTVAQDQFGSGVGLDGNIAVVGAPDPFDLFGPASGPGRAFIFRRTGTTWAEEASLTASDGLSTDQFGHSASVAIDRAVIGANGDQASGSGSRYGGRGGAYVFHNTTGTTWTQEAKLVGTDALAGDLAGTSVSIDPTDNDLVAMGAPGQDGTGVDSGAVYLWVGDPLQPPISATLGGYAGVLHHVPFLFILSAFPENPRPLVLNYGPLTPSIAGVPLPFQALVTGEGGAKGSFSNVRMVTIP